VGLLIIRIQTRSYSRDGNGHIHQNISPISSQVLVFNGGMRILYLLLYPKFWYLIPLQMALYADSERGRYPVWQSLDHPNFFPGSRIVFVTVTVEFFYIYYQTLFLFFFLNLSKNMNPQVVFIYRAILR
jgi:hypothetical protein